MINKEIIIDNVKVRYGAVARGASDCCEGGVGFASCSPTYLIEHISDLPEEALAASAGCGNPNAIGQLRQGETVVDFGCGAGIDCFIAAKLVGGTGHVIGVDMTTDMLNLAHKNKKTARADNVDFLLAQIDDTGIDSGSVDVIISNCVIVLAPDKDAVFKEAARILRKGGRLHISDVVLTSELPYAVAREMEKWTHCISGAEMADKYMSKIRNAGFSHVEVVSDVPYEWHTDEDWINSVRSMNILAIK